MGLREFAEEVYNALDEEYPDARCTLNHSNNLELLIATQLSAQCKDERVNQVTQVLFPKFKGVKDYAECNPKKIARIIKTLGLYKTKSENIVECCQQLIENFGGEVPSTMEELLTLKGVGRKTANLILGEAFGQPAYIVDTHAKRVSRRIGLTYGESTQYVETELRRILKPETSCRFCHLLVHLGRNHCKAINPDCEECPINDICKQNFDLESVVNKKAPYRYKR